MLVDYSTNTSMSKLPPWVLSLNGVFILNVSCAKSSYDTNCVYCAPEFGLIFRYDLID